MTNHRPQHENWWARVISNLLLAGVAALGTHLIDVLAVKDKVDSIREEQIINSKWRIETQARFDMLKAFEENDLPSILNGQRIMGQKMADIENELLDHERKEKLREKRRRDTK